MAASIEFMKNKIPDNKADFLPDIDRGELIALIEPLLLGQEVSIRPEL